MAAHPLMCYVFVVVGWVVFVRGVFAYVQVKRAAARRGALRRHDGLDA